jgi:streptomycin 6-kinase
VHAVDVASPWAQNGHVADLTIPGRLARSAQRPESPARGWFDALPGTVGAVTQRWGLRLGPPFQPGGVGSWVAPGTDAAGRDVVLKLRWRYPEAAAEASALTAWDGNAAVRLLDVLTDADGLLAPDTDALLLERCRPGHALGMVVTQGEQDIVIAGLLRRLHSTPPPAGVPTLASMCDAWAAETQEKYDALWTAGESTPLSAAEVAEGLALLRSLASEGTEGTASGPGAVLLCTDLHAENVVSARREPWLVIDPHPHVGDPTYDLLQHLLNCRDRLLAEPRWLVDRLARLLDVDPTRARRWLFARSVQESVESPWLVAVAKAMRPS